ncbi:MAG: TonB C-terminal domain-containing protein [Polyangiaceae bacterium]|nr:TonB C-terminal domain-containing protein [Polyangiaceae bacterium]
MTARAHGSFDAQEVTMAVAVALLAQLGFVAVFSMPSPKLVQAEISNDNAQPIAVAITPVLKLGSKTPDKVPSKWQRQRVSAKTPPQRETALPSTRAEKTPEAIPTSHAPATPLEVDASRPEPATLTAEAGPTAPVTSVEGSEQGAAEGTETDALKARAADLYRAQLQAWFASHFHIRGKIPFDTLKGLHAAITVSISPDRKVDGFQIERPSGDSTFDDEVRATLSQIQSSGVELPAPPPMYPDILRSTLPVGFACNVRKNCE